VQAVVARRLIPNRAISQEEAKRILEPHLAKLRDCVEKAWAEYQGAHYADVRHHHTTRSRASLIHDHIVAYARQYFQGDPHVRIFTKRGRTMANISDKLLVRFKKLDARKRSRGVPTEQFVLFGAQIDFDGIPSSLTHLEVGYVLDGLQTELAGVYITCPNIRSVEWFIDLREAVAAPAAAGTTIPPMNAPDPAGSGLQQAQTRQKRFRAKGASDADRKKQTGGGTGGPNQS
jgi:hypothetical protein